jgi:hypothetical protein
MVTTTTSLLQDIEEYFADHNVKPGAYPRLNPTGLLRRAHELIVELEDKIYDLKMQDHKLKRPFVSDCTCWRDLDDNDDS